MDRTCNTATALVQLQHKYLHVDEEDFSCPDYICPSSASEAKCSTGFEGSALRTELLKRLKDSSDWMLKCSPRICHRNLQ
eukprot:1159962-Pelagomonas_calceolata.AAC.2